MSWFGVWMGDGSGGGAPPVITNITPPQNTLVDRDTVIGLDVTDDVGFRLLQVLVYYPNGKTNVIFKGVAFVDREFLPGVDPANPIPAVAVATPITNGFHLDIRPAGGWADQPTFDVDAIDVGGNQGVVT